MFNFHKNKKCFHLLFIWRRWHLASVGCARWRFLALHHGQRGQRTHRVAIHVKAINFDSRLWGKDKSTHRERVREAESERDSKKGKEIGRTGGRFIIFVGYQNQSAAATGTTTTTITRAIRITNAAFA